MDGTVERSSTLTIDAQVYRFGANGCAKTGWVLDGDSWYYHSSTGAQQSGWLTLGTDMYYLDPTTGAMATGWFTDGGAWYYLQPGTGAMATGWIRIGGSGTTSPTRASSCSIPAMVPRRAPRSRLEHRVGMRAHKVPGFSQVACGVPQGWLLTVGAIAREYGAGRMGPSNADELRLRSYLGELALC